MISQPELPLMHWRQAWQLRQGTCNRLPDEESVETIDEPMMSPRRAG